MEMVRRIGAFALNLEKSMFSWMKTALLMAGITALFGALGGMIGGQQGMLMALGFALLSNFFAYWFSDRMVLRMYNAREVDETSAPQYYGMVRELAERANLPMPRVYLIDEDAPNAFATGRDPQHAAVAATTGILRVLSARELRGVASLSNAAKEKSCIMSYVRYKDNLLFIFRPDWDRGDVGPVCGHAHSDGHFAGPRI